MHLLRFLLPLLAACSPEDTTDSATSAAAPPCGLTEGSWALTVGGDDPVCTNGLETANGADVTATCTVPDEGVSSLQWTGKGVGQAITCTRTDAGLHCAFGGIDLDATLSADGQTFSGAWAGLSCNGTWSGAAE